MRFDESRVRARETDRASSASGRTTGDFVTTRRRLYAQVWSVPMRELASQFGISGVALEKACDVHEVPRPKPGHWAKVQHGQRPVQPPLRAASDPGLETIRISGKWADRRALLERMRADPQVAALLKRDAAARPFEVRPTLRRTHDLVRRRAQHFEASAIRGTSGSPKSAAAWSLDVSEPHMHRALRIVDALLRGLEERGFTVDAVAGARGPKVRIAVLRVQFVLHVRERLRRAMTFTPASGGDRAWAHAGLEGRGELELFLHVRGGGARRCWRDTAGRPLEKKLREIPRGILELAAAELER